MKRIRLCAFLLFFAFCISFCACGPLSAVVCPLCTKVCPKDSVVCVLCGYDLSWGNGYVPVTTADDGTPVQTTAVSGDPTQTTAVSGDPAQTTAVSGDPAQTTAAQSYETGTTATSETLQTETSVVGCSDCIAKGSETCLGHDCNVCHGTARIVCGVCKGTGEGIFENECAICRGTTMIPCVYCYGTGKIYRGS